MKQFSFALVAFVSSTLISTAIAASCAPIDNVELTFYGWPDNDPPSPDNAFDCGRGNGPDGNPIAGGTGTYSDPISFATATDNSNFAKCAIVYVPSLRKYFRNEDDCAECKTDWDTSQKYHIDLWTGSNQEAQPGVVGCENSLPGGASTIINNAPDGLPVDSTPLYDGSTCYQTKYTDFTASSLCSGGSGSGNTTGGSTGKGTGASSSGVSSPEIGTATTFSTATSKPTGTTSKGGRPVQPAGTCAWPGHCKGATCQSENDCSDVMVCIGGKCADP